MPDDSPLVMSKADLKALFQEAISSIPPRETSLSKDDLTDIVSTCVSETLTKLGIEIDEPLHVQLDMAFLRSLRKTSSLIKKNSIYAVAFVFVSAIAGMLWIGFSRSIGGK